MASRPPPPPSSSAGRPSDACRKSFEPSPGDVESLSGNQKLVFLDQVEQDARLSAERARLMGRAYDFVSSKNVEIKTSYYIVALKAGDTTCAQGAADLLGTVGRMKFVRPLFRALNKVDRGLALDTFAKNSEFYHPICRGMVQKDLGL